MKLHHDMNTLELRVAYLVYQIKSVISKNFNFAKYWNSLALNKFEVEDKQKNYLLNRDVNFHSKKNRYIASLTHKYRYFPEEVNTGEFRRVGRNVCVKTGTADIPSDNVISVYPYLRLEVVGSMELIVSVSNEANWEIDFYVNESGELCVNTDNEYKKQ